jgi:hypothetical protein
MRSAPSESPTSILQNSSYHKDRQGPFSNPPIEAPNDLDAIIKLIR